MVSVQESSNCNYLFEGRVAGGSLYRLPVSACFLHLFSCTHFLVEKRLFYQKNTGIDGIKSEGDTVWQEATLAVLRLSLVTRA